MNQTVLTYGQLSDEYGKCYVIVLIIMVQFSFRFANTISAQFYGHTHNDQFMMWYDTETNSVPINVGYVTPSVTTYTGLNPSYRIYTIDGPYENASMVSH